MSCRRKKNKESRSDFSLPRKEREKEDGVCKREETEPFHRLRGGRRLYIARKKKAKKGAKAGYFRSPKGKKKKKVLYAPFSQGKKEGGWHSKERTGEETSHPYAKGKREPLFFLGRKGKREVTLGKSRNHHQEGGVNSLSKGKRLRSDGVSTRNI